MIITIDGLSGVGKSTIAKALSQELGYDFVSTGQIYRMLALLILDEEIVPEDTTAVVERIDELSLLFEDHVLVTNYKTDNGRMECEETAYVAALIGKNRICKKRLSERIIKMVQGKNCVVEGRNAGNILFPNAELKIYLYADIEIRVKRKLHWLTSTSASIERNRLNIRDKFVASSAPEDAYKIDTGNKTVAETLQEILEHMNSVLYS